MKCPNCGAQLRGEICEYCGSAVEKPKAENEQKNRGGPRLLVWLVFIFIFVMAIDVYKRQPDTRLRSGRWPAAP